jgi:hypothetical protein
MVLKKLKFLERVTTPFVVLNGVKHLLSAITYFRADASFLPPQDDNFFYPCSLIYLAVNGMAQLVARRAHNPKVVGSSPAPES